VCATTAMLRLIMHELPVHKFVHPALAAPRGLELVELEVSESSPFADAYVQDMTAGRCAARGHRPRRQAVARGSTMILAGDYVLCLVPRGKEKTSSRPSCPRRSRSAWRRPRSSTRPVVTAASGRAAPAPARPRPAGARLQRRG